MKRPLPWLLSLSLVSTLAWAPAARADDERTFHSRPQLELPLLASFATLWMASEFAKPALAPSACRWCRENPLDAPIRDALHWENPKPAHRLSDALLFGLVPAVGIGGVFALGLSAADASQGLTDAVIVSEALVLAASLTQIAKYSAARMRPYVRAQRDAEHDYPASPDDNLSFFSGHTSATFAIAVAAGTTASLRGYRLAPVIWSVATPLAALTGYLRIAADRHYFTDVLTGALVGTLVGVLVPYLHTKRVNLTMGAAPPATFTIGFTR